MVRRRINIACLQETKWVGEKAKEIEDTGFKLYYSGKQRNKNGIGIIVDKNLKKDVVNVIRKGDRIILIKLVIGRDIINIISAYAPQVGLDEQTKTQFWELMDELIRGVPSDEKLYIGGDFNGHVGRDCVGYELVHGGHGFGDRNGDGERILDFAVAFNLVIANTYYIKRDEHLITFKSGTNKSQIDFFLTRKTDKTCKNCKVIPGESLTTQHRVLVLDIIIKNQLRKRKENNNPRTRWWNLKGENLEHFKGKVLKEDVWTLDEEPNTMWNKVAVCIRGHAKEVLGESKGKGPQTKETWWWDEEVQKAVKRKRTNFKTWQMNKNMENWESYKNANKEAKKAVRDAKSKVFGDFYKKLESKEGERNIYRLAKRRDMKTRDLTSVKCIKGEDSRVLVQENEINERWTSYFEKLLNENHRDNICLEAERRDNTFFRRISVLEVKKALRKMNTGRALGPDGIPIEVWKHLGDKGLTWLTRLFNKIMMAGRMPDEWRKSTLVPIYKNKGDVQSCSNYRGIKLMSHTMKLWERVIEHRLRVETTVSENQFGFMPGRSTMEAIHLLRTLMEKYREKKKNLHLAFIDLEKAYDRVPREIIWGVLDKKGVTLRYIDVIKDMYNGVVTMVRTPTGEGSEFPVTIGLHQGSALSPYLFALIMDELTREIQDDVPWCMLFADDIVLIDETKAGLNTKLERWREALETRGFRISRTKTEYMECDFSNHKESIEDIVKLEGQNLPKRDMFRYLGSIIHREGDITEDVTHRIKAGWLKWRSASGVLCDRRIPVKLKGKFYRTAVRPALLYGAECWATKKHHVQKMSVTEMRMIRWMCGKTRKDKMRNEHIRGLVGVAPIQDKIRENRLRWFGHIRRRPVNAVVRKTELIIVEGNIKGRGRPKLTWGETVRKDMSVCGLTEDIVLDRKEWRKRIHVADPN